MTTAGLTSADDRIREVRAPVRTIDSTRPAQMDQLFYMHCHDELVLAVRDLLDVIDRRLDRGKGAPVRGEYDLTARSMTEGSPARHPRVSGFRRKRLVEAY